jgi:hypothetical protein
VSTIRQRFATRVPTVCAVCRRRAVWLGHAPLGNRLTRNGPTIWLCDNSDCHRSAWRLHQMPSSVLDAFEEASALEAAAEAGRYLEEVGTTDLARLTDQEWREFLRRMFTGFEQALRRKILDREDNPPL